MKTNAPSQKKKNSQWVRSIIWVTRSRARFGSDDKDKGIILEVLFLLRKEKEEEKEKQNWMNNNTRIIFSYDGSCVV
jgi:hypothetical protein